MKRGIRRKLRTAALLVVVCLVASLAAAGQTRSQTRPALIPDLRPTVILISIDGFRADYFEKYAPPHLTGLARGGVRAKWMTPSFPSKTFPNHYAIVTGLYPQNNGIVENTIYDSAFDAVFSMDNREEVKNGRWWLGEPVWITAEKQGQKTAPFFFPGSESEIGGKRPTYWKPYDGKISNVERVDTLLGLLDLAPEKRPTFLTLYFSDVDDAGHRHSPESRETRVAVLKVDGVIGRLIDGLKARGVFDRVNLIIVSDHGMASVDPHNVIILDELFNESLAKRVLWTAEIVGIFPKPGKEDRIYEELRKKLTAHARIYRKAELPARFHYSNSSRIPPLLVLPDEGWTLVQRSRHEEMMRKRDASHLRGGHGYDNQLVSMRAIFIGHGEAFERGRVVEPFENVDVYDIMTSILGLRPAANDGHPETVRAVLKTGDARQK